MQIDNENLQELLGEGRFWFQKKSKGVQQVEKCCILVIMISDQKRWLFKKVISFQKKVKCAAFRKKSADFSEKSLFREILGKTRFKILSHDLSKIAENCVSIFFVIGRDFFSRSVEKTKSITKMKILVWKNQK